jgi:hypothetical protein
LRGDGECGLSTAHPNNKIGIVTKIPSLTIRTGSGFITALNQTPSTITPCLVADIGTVVKFFNEGFNVYKGLGSNDDDNHGTILGIRLAIGGHFRSSYRVRHLFRIKILIRIFYDLYLKSLTQQSRAISKSNANI